MRVECDGYRASMVCIARHITRSAATVYLSALAGTAIVLDIKTTTIHIPIPTFDLYRAARPDGRMQAKILRGKLPELHYADLASQRRTRASRIVPRSGRDLEAQLRAAGLAVTAERCHVWPRSPTRLGVAVCPGGVVICPHANHHTKDSAAGCRRLRLRSARRC
jgi:hypothetical protein